MAGGRVPPPSRFIRLISALVFILCLAGEFDFLWMILTTVTGSRSAEDWKCQSSPVIHKKVGEDVELSCFQGGNIFHAAWNYNNSVAAEYSDGEVTYSEQWKDRLYLNITNFSLTVKNLKPSDSGIFSFIFLTGPPLQQHPSVSFSLQVHEVLTALPVLTSNSTRDTLTRVCTVLLECSSEATGGVTYRWTVRNQTITGPSLTYTIREEDGDTVFKCTVGNIVSEVSESKVLKCVNQTGEAAADSNHRTVILVAGITACVVIVAAGIALCVCHRRRKQATGLVIDQTVYADVSDVAPQNEWQPCSVYDSIDNRDSSMPQTVYDKIQFKYLRTEASDRIAA
ncbi:uncharacterized protein LOC130523212 isoform X2 [Takifugu flavidus]|uniref:uncharacterized protein LOC130523212 isoform X2 n=1 Tax=Takifugu flavidus TaxID=433684 RepID=UPI0025440DE4|nr:uncharacterized protein LOC130523212 isoform X2 [Takifugu flavidus]